MHEHQPEVLGVNPGIATIPLFWVDFPASSEGIRLSAEFPRAETNDQVELGQKFRPPGLLVGEHFRGGEILQIFVVGDHIYRGSRTLKVVVPSLESFEYSQEFLVMHVVVQLRGCVKSGSSLGASSQVQNDLQGGEMGRALLRSRVAGRGSRDRLDSTTGSRSVDPLRGFRSSREYESGRRD